MTFNRWFQRRFEKATNGEKFTAKLHLRISENRSDTPTRTANRKNRLKQAGVNRSFRLR